MQSTPTGNRWHIGVYGRRNVGKSSLINQLTNQDLTVVSEVPGTTTDPVYKRMELIPIGPVVMIDTAGIDDTGDLGQQRVKKTREVIRRTDLALLVVDPELGIADFERELLDSFEDRETPVLLVINKIDLVDNSQQAETEVREQLPAGDYRMISVSASHGQGLNELRDMIADMVPEENKETCIIGDLIQPGETVILVTPIDLAAPKGRLILPQVQTIRDVLDHKGIAVINKETELTASLQNLEHPPAMVVTDSQAFSQVDELVPNNILLTGFSILFARYKGDLELYMEGTRRLQRLTPDNKVLIAEACTHRRTADDIGTVKIPNWLKQQVGEGLQFDHVAGREYPENLGEYDLVLHCGGCMLNRREVLTRLYEAREARVPVINYGMAIAQLHGILDRALQPFPDIHEIWNQDQKQVGAGL
ncbi:MAG: [FeFe] hydrogenase H-cluster maturation GTPase HydF [Bacillota bacterium]